MRGEGKRVRAGERMERRGARRGLAANDENRMTNDETNWNGSMAGGRGILRGE